MTDLLALHPTEEANFHWEMKAVFTTWNHAGYDWYGGSIAAWHAFRSIQETEISMERLYNTHYLCEHFSVTSSCNISLWVVATVMQGSIWSQF